MKEAGSRWTKGDSWSPGWQAPSLTFAGGEDYQGWEAEGNGQAERQGQSWAGVLEGT